MHRNHSTTSRVLFVSITSMKRNLRTPVAICLAIFLSGALFGLSARTSFAQAETASISFKVQITPSTGLAEPVRGLPILLLRKSFTAIQADAESSVPHPSMDKFIDTLKLSKALIDWMRKNHTVSLTGEEFAKNLTPQEIINIPEFWQAYFEINAGSKAFGFPMPKYDQRDQTRNPAKYQREIDDYHARVTKYILQNPDSKAEMDEELSPIDPSPQWNDKIAERESQIHRMALDWAQSRYFVAQTQTDANGLAGFTGVAPGTYWLSSLNIYGQAGDTREKWDTQVEVRAGDAKQVILSNYNAVPSKPLP
jgi:hypothetical protein